MASDNKNLNLAENRIEKSTLKYENKLILRSFMNSSISGRNTTKKAIKTINGQILVLCKFLERFDKEARDVTEEEIDSYLVYIKMTKKLSLSTCNLYGLIVKQFYKWLDGGIHEDKVKWIKGGKTGKRDLNETTLLLPSEINAMVRSCDRFRDKAMTLGLYESACRISEFTGIRIKDLMFDDYGCKIRVDGKTGPRTIRLIDSTPYFHKWLEEHPFKTNPDSPLWISYATNFYGQQLNERTFRKKISTIAKRAGIIKKVFPHLFRHSRLTWLAQNENFTEMHLRVIAGWSETSEMASRYTHITENDVDKKLRQAKGLVDTKETSNQLMQRKILDPKKCSRCGKNYPNDTLYCTCGMCLNPIESMNIEQTKEIAVNEAMSELIKIMKDPIRMREFEKFKSNF